MATKKNTSKKNTEPKPIIIDPIAEMKKLPDSFWVSMPTFSNVHFSPQNKHDTNKYFRQSLPGNTWDVFLEKAHLLNPYWCSENLYHFLGDGWNNKQNPTFAVYQIGNAKIRSHCPYGATHVGIEVQCWEPMTNSIGDEVPGGDWERAMYSENLRNAIDKIASTWNKLRKEALRRKGLEKSPKEQKKARSQKTADAREKARQEAYAQALETRDALNAFIVKLRNDDVTKDDIGSIYDDLIRLTQHNVAYREAAASTMPRSK